MSKTIEIWKIHNYEMNKITWFSSLIMNNNNYNFKKEFDDR